MRTYAYIVVCDVAMPVDADGQIADARRALVEAGLEHAKVWCGDGADARFSGIYLSAHEPTFASEV